MSEKPDKQPKNKNLKRGRWKPGVSGNPKGRPPKQFSLTSKVKEMLDNPCPYDGTMTWLEYLAEKWLNQAAENPTYFKELIERLEGKITQPLTAEIETTDAKSLSESELDRRIRAEITRLAKGKAKKTKRKK